MLDLLILSSVKISQCRKTPQGLSLSLEIWRKARPTRNAGSPFTNTKLWYLVTDNLVAQLNVEKQEQERKKKRRSFASDSAVLQTGACCSRFTHVIAYFHGGGQGGTFQNPSLQPLQSRSHSRPVRRSGSPSRVAHVLWLG